MGWMADTQPVRNQLRDYQMTEPANPKGSLTVSITLLSFDAASDMYRKLNHGLVERVVSFIEGLECTKDEAEKLVDRLRKANPDLTITAGWHGATNL